jgi:hypothetical protein
MMKLKAATVLYTVILCTLVSGVCSCILLAFHFFIDRQHQLSVSHRLIRNIHSALELYAAEVYRMNETSNLRRIEFGENEYVNAASMPWGIFTLCQMTSVHQGRQHRMSYWMGKMQMNKGLAIVITDPKALLTVAGSTVIRGTCHVPGGNIRKSLHDVPNLFVDKDVKVHDNITQPFAFTSMAKNGITAFSFSSSDGMRVSRKSDHQIPSYRFQSFLDSTLVIYSSDSIQLEDQTLVGNMIVVSDKNIIVGRNARLNGIILNAPSIRFESGVHVSLQALAQRSIVTGDSCIFRYPSVLSSGDGHHKAALRMGRHSRLDGYLFVWGSKENTAISEFLARDVHVRGSVLVQGVCDISGMVKGSVICSYFRRQESHRSWDHYLVDCTIDGSTAYGNFHWLNNSYGHAYAKIIQALR